MFLCSWDADFPTKLLCRGLTKGWFSKRVVLADPPTERKSERGYIRLFPRNENRNEGTFACSPGTKTGTRGHSPKPPFYEPPSSLTVILKSSSDSENINSVDISAPKKKKLPPPPPKNSPIHCRHPPGPPLLGFSIKNWSPPPPPSSQLPELPLPPPRGDKKLKRSETSTKSRWMRPSGAVRLLRESPSTITIMNRTSRCSSRCSSRCAIHYGYRAWTLPYLGGQNLYTNAAWRGFPTNTFKALWCICIFLLFPLKASFLVYTKPLFCLLRQLSFQSWKHLWCILFSLRLSSVQSHRSLLHAWLFKTLAALGCSFEDVWESEP